MPRPSLTSELNALLSKPNILPLPPTLAEVSKVRGTWIFVTHATSSKRADIIRWWKTYKQVIDIVEIGTAEEWMAKLGGGNFPSATDILISGIDNNQHFLDRLHSPLVEVFAAIGDQNLLGLQTAVDLLLKDHSDALHKVRQNCVTAVKIHMAGVETDMETAIGVIRYSISCVAHLGQLDDMAYFLLLYGNALKRQLKFDHKENLEEALLVFRHSSTLSSHLLGQEGYNLINHLDALYYTAVAYGIRSNGDHRDNILAAVQSQLAALAHIDSDPSEKQSNELMMQIKQMKAMINTNMSFVIRAASPDLATAIFSLRLCCEALGYRNYNLDARDWAYSVLELGYSCWVTAKLLDNASETSNVPPSAKWIAPYLLVIETLVRHSSAIGAGIALSDTILSQVQQISTCTLSPSDYDVVPLNLLEMLSEVVLKLVEISNNAERQEADCSSNIATTFSNIPRTQSADNGQAQTEDLDSNFAMLSCSTSTRQSTPGSRNCRHKLFLTLAKASASLILSHGLENHQFHMEAHSLLGEIASTEASVLSTERQEDLGSLWNKYKPKLPPKTKALICKWSDVIAHRERALDISRRIDNKEKQLFITGSLIEAKLQLDDFTAGVRLFEELNESHFRAGRTYNKRALFESVAFAFEELRQWEQSAKAHMASLALVTEVYSDFSDATRHEHNRGTNDRRFRRASFALAKAGQVKAAILALEDGRGREIKLRTLIETIPAVKLEALSDVQRESLRRWHTKLLSVDSGGDDKDRTNDELTGILQRCGIDISVLTSRWEDVVAASEPGWPVVYINAMPRGITYLAFDHTGEEFSVISDNMTGRLAFALHMEFNYYDRETRWKSFVSGLKGNTDRLGTWVNDDLSKIMEAMRQEGVTIDGLTIVPCGFLVGIPLHAGLLDGYHVLDKVALRYLPSAHLGRVIKSRLANISPATSAFLVALANPTLPEEGDSGSARIRVQLRAAEIECKEIASAFPKDRTVVYSGPSATLFSLQGSIEDATHLHMACHGKGDHFSLDTPSLLLADGPLKMTELSSKLGQMADRVTTLSACDNSSTFHKTPDEALNFPSFIIAGGSACCIGSLWQLDDLVAALCMTRFYELHLGTCSSASPVAAIGNNPAIALQQAQIWLKSVSLRGDDPFFLRHPKLKDSLECWVDNHAFEGETPFSHPVHWAPWIAVGF